MADTVSNEQLEELLEFLDEHPGLAKGIGLGARSKETVDKQWNELATKLNSYGSGSTKSGERWKKYWEDLKYKSMDRLAKRRRDALATGDGPGSQKDLSEVDKRVLAIVGEQAIFGDIEHRIPGMNIQLANEVQTFTEPQKLLIKDNVMENIPIIPNSPSIRGQTTRIYTSEISVSHGTSSETQLVEPLQTDVQNPVSRPNVDCSGPYSKRKRVLSTPSRQPGPSRISEWVMELERNRVEAEKKFACAALIMAKASRVQADAGRVQADSIFMLVELVSKQSAEIRLLLRSINQNSAESAQS